MEHNIIKRETTYSVHTMRYYPDLGYQAAVRRFRREIHGTRALLDVSFLADWGKVVR